LLPPTGACIWLPDEMPVLLPSSLDELEPEPESDEPEPESSDVLDVEFVGVVAADE
jgi:hypothetical protein